MMQNINFCDVNLNGHLSLKNIPNDLISKAKAIIFVHYGGVEIDMKKSMKWARKNQLRVIEDSAHSFGSTQYYKKLGDRDFDFVCYSFDGIKNITTAEGGCVCAKNKNDQLRLKDIRLLGVKDDTNKRQLNLRTWEPKVSEQGWRAHMSNVNAAIGIAQLNRSKELWAKRKYIANYYYQKLKEFSDHLNLIIPNDKGIVPHIYPVIIFDKVKLNKIFSSFKSNFIQYGRHYFPCDNLEFFKDYPKCSLKNTYYLYNHLISLPLHCDLTDDDLNIVINTLINNLINL